MAKTLVIIPAFNEASNIALVIQSLRQSIDSHTDILVINDGSTDDTESVVRSLGVSCVKLPFNMGIGNAVHTGYLYAFRNGYDFAVQFDGDGQHPAEEIPRLVNLLAENFADVVIGSRFIPNNRDGYQSSVGRRAGIDFLSRLIRILTGKQVYDPTSGFRAINKKALSVYANYYPHDYPEPEAIVVGIRKNLRILETPVKMKVRQGGTSSINFIGSVYYLFKVSLAVWIKSLECREGAHANN